MTDRFAIHPTALVAPDVEVGDGTVIGPGAVVLAPCRIGQRCWIGPHAVIGGTPEHVDHMVVPTVPDTGPIPDEASLWSGPQGAGVVIGDGTIVRELSTIHSGTVAPTRVGSEVFMMTKTHVAHDNVIGDRVRMASYANLGGHVVVGADANLGLSAAVHQHRVVGPGAMVGMHATVVHDVRPYELVRGTPARASGVNRHWLRRAGVAAEDVEGLADFYAGRRETPPERFAAAVTEWSSLVS